MAIITPDTWRPSAPEIKVAVTENLRLFLNGEETPGVVYCDYALDEEGYAAGVFRYIVIGKNRPRAGARYHSLSLAYQPEDSRELVTILRTANVVIRGELGSLNDHGVFEIECRWHNDGGADAD